MHFLLCNIFNKFSLCYLFTWRYITLLLVIFHLYYHVLFVYESFQFNIDLFVMSPWQQSFYNNPVIYLSCLIRYFCWGTYFISWPSKFCGNGFCFNYLSKKLKGFFPCSLESQKCEVYYIVCGLSLFPR